MSMECGGRADKGGNEYENSILARRLIDLLYERVSNVEVEPLGEEGKGVDFIVTGVDGAREYVQCKASNGMNDHWGPSDFDIYQGKAGYGFFL